MSYECIMFDWLTAAVANSLNDFLCLLMGLSKIPVARINRLALSIPCLLLFFRSVNETTNELVWSLSTQVTSTFDRIESEAQLYKDMLRNMLPLDTEEAGNTLEGMFGISVDNILRMNNLVKIAFLRNSGPVRSESPTQTQTSIVHRVEGWSLESYVELLSKDYIAILYGTFSRCMI